MVHDVHTTLPIAIRAHRYETIFSLQLSTQIPKTCRNSRGSFIFTMHRESCCCCRERHAAVHANSCSCIYLSIYLFVSSLSFVRSPLAIAIPKDQNRFHGKYLQCLYVWDHRSTPACSNLQRNKCAFRFFTFFPSLRVALRFFRLLSFFFFVSTCFFFYVSCYKNILRMWWHKFAAAARQVH